MNLKIDKSFLKSFTKLNQVNLKPKIENLISEITRANNLKDLKQVKKLNGFVNFYRFKIGDYRVGFELEDSSTIVLILIAHRKDIYKRFP